MSARPRHPSLAAAALRRLAVAVLIATSIAALGCGRRGDPQPPLRFVPNVTTDLTVRQQGDLVTLELGYPQTTSGGLALPGLDSVEVLALVSDQPAATAREIDPRAFAGSASVRATIAGPELESAVFGDRLRLRLPLATLAGEPVRTAGSLVLGVRTTSSTAEASDVSNLAALDLRVAAGVPGGLVATPQAEGIALEWTAADGEEGYTIYRRRSTERGYGAPLGRTAADELRYLDRDASYGESYFYTVRAILASEPLVESEAAIEREVDYRDTFAPEPPRSLSALAEEERVRLVLEPSPSGDVVGYRVYRRDPGAEFRPITAEPLTDLEHLDDGLTTGLTYLYRATAIDAAGNEGAPGAEVSVTVR